MAIDQLKKENNISEATNEPKAAASPGDSTPKGAAGLAATNSQEALVKAMKDAEAAKESVRKAINQAFREREESLKRAESLAQAFDKAIQGVPILPAIGAKTGDPAKTPPSEPPRQSIMKKILKTGTSPLKVADNVTKPFFTDQVDPGTKQDFFDQVVKQSKSFKQLVENLSDAEARKKADRMMDSVRKVSAKEAAAGAEAEARKAREETEATRKAAEEAIIRAKEETATTRKNAEAAINITREWIEQARSKVMADKKAAEILSSQAQHQAVTQAAEEIQKAREEVRGAKAAADAAVKMAREEITRARAESEEIKKKALSAMADADEKVLKAAEKIKVIKQQSVFSISEAEGKAQKAMEQAERVKIESGAAIERAELESRQAIEEARLDIKKSQEAVMQAEQLAYEQIRAKMEELKKEAEKTQRSAYEAAIAAKEEARQAKQQAEIVKRASEEAVLRALEERRISREEAEQTRQALLETISSAQDEVKKAREEAEAAILKANEAMIIAQKDMIGRTIDEISSTRLELEESLKDPGKLISAAGDTPVTVTGLDPMDFAAVVNEMRAPLHSISGFARLLMAEDMPDGMTRQEFLTIVVEQSENLGRLVDDLSVKLESAVSQDPAGIEKSTTGPTIENSEI